MTFNFKELRENFSKALMYMHPEAVAFWKTLECPKKYHQLGMSTSGNIIMFIINFGESFHPVMVLGSINESGQKVYCIDGHSYKEDVYLKMIKMKAFW
jgi:hypothetical protein